METTENIVTDIKKIGSEESPPQNKYQNNYWIQFFDLRTSRGQILFLIITILISILIQYIPDNTIRTLLPASISFLGTYYKYVCGDVDQPLAETRSHWNPSYAIYSKNANSGHLKHVHLVLQRLGYRETTLNEDWDLLWAHDYPFRLLANSLKNINFYQKVNHFPGSGYITNKVDLCTSNLPYIPKAFKFPKDKEIFLEYTRKFPNKLFVQKHNQHRHIYIKSVDEIDFKSNNSFIQEFLDNPYLVDGYKFDIGVYVIITSVNPLRVYIYQGDVLFRYCPVKYYPFDAKNVDKYIVGDDYLPTWKVPSLTDYYNRLGFGMKDSFDAYLRSKNQNPRIIWTQVENAIRIAILSNEQHVINILNKNYDLGRNFFEMIRFDLVITNDLRVHLMEANMSPNLSSAHFKQNTLLYEQVIYSLLNLVDVGSPIERASLRKDSTDTEEMLCSMKNIMVDAEICSTTPCIESCSAPKCHVCKPCLSFEDLETLHMAFREHLHKINTKRIFPSPIVNLASYNISKEIENLNTKNQMMTRWFYGKCKIDNSWCY